MKVWTLEIIIVSDVNGHWNVEYNENYDEQHMFLDRLTVLSVEIAILVLIPTIDSYING